MAIGIIGKSMAQHISGAFSNDAPERELIVAPALRLRNKPLARQSFPTTRLVAECRAIVNVEISSARLCLPDRQAWGLDIDGYPHPLPIIRRVAM